MTEAEYHQKKWAVYSRETELLFGLLRHPTETTHELYNKGMEQCLEERGKLDRAWKILRAGREKKARASLFWEFILVLALCSAIAWMLT